MDQQHRLPPNSRSLPPITSITAYTDNPPPPAEISPLPFRNAPPHPDPRDSGNWSASKHSSGISNNGFPLQSILNSEDSPSRNSMPSSIPETPSSIKGPLHPLPSLTQGFDPRASVDANSLLDSRRSSVDSRMNVGMGHLQISPSTAMPYDKSQNVSRTSIVSNLAQQRGIAPDQRQSASGPLSPMGVRTNGLRPHSAPRRAPVINPNPRSISEMPNPTAENPTKGFPWAFPDSEPPNQQRHSSSGDSELDMRPSRQNSFAASVNSSIYTNDSAMPPGQKRFSDDMPQTHHHSIHNHVSSLRPDGPSAASPGAGNYSRTPELRISHKMAERKRRSEMKNLFDELNNILPSPAGGKSSKWEVLTRAIDYINKNKGDLNRVSQYRSEVEKSRNEQGQIRDEATAMWQNLRRLEPNHPHIYGPYTSSLASHQAPEPPSMARPLPPMQSNAWPQGPSVMQGVEYPQSHGYERR